MPARSRLTLTLVIAALLAASPVHAVPVSFDVSGYVGLEWYTDAAIPTPAYATGAWTVNGRFTFDSVTGSAAGDAYGGQVELCPREGQATPCRSFSVGGVTLQVIDAPAGYNGSDEYGVFLDDPARGLYITIYGADPSGAALASSSPPLTPPAGLGTLLEFFWYEQRHDLASDALIVGPGNVSLQLVSAVAAPGGAGAPRAQVPELGAGTLVILAAMTGLVLTRRQRVRRT